MHPPMSFWSGPPQTPPPLETHFLGGGVGGVGGVGGLGGGVKMSKK